MSTTRQAKCRKRLSILAIMAIVVALTSPHSVFSSATLAFSTYFGGGNTVGNDAGWAVVSDSGGNVYVVGSTSDGNDFPTTPGVFQQSKPGMDDAFVAKFDASGSLLFSTFLGGTGLDIGAAIAVDGNGDVYVGGTTRSADFPTTPGALQTSLGGVADAFVAKLSSDGGTLLYSTYLGGSGSSEWVSGIVVDAGGSAVAIGRTGSNDFPVTTGAFDTDCGAGASCDALNEDAFVAKINGDGSALVYSTFLGGATRDFATHVATDSSGSVLLVGSTAATDYPVSVDAFDDSKSGGLDGFLTQLSPDGATLEYSTFLGGGATDVATGVALDAAGDVYVGGYTRSDDYPTTSGAFDEICGDGTGCAASLDTFVTKIKTDGNPPVFSTFLGGAGLDFGFGIAVDPEGQVHVAGATMSTDFPVQDPIQGSLVSAASCALDSTGVEVPGEPCTDIYVVKFAADGASLLFSDFLGGTDGESRWAVPDFHHGLALSGAGDVHVVGISYSIDFPTANAHQGSRSGINDAVVVKLAGLPGSDTTPPVADAGANQAIHAGDLVVLDGSGSFDDNTATLDLAYSWSFVTRPSGSTALLSSPTTSSPSFVADRPGTYLVDLIVTDEAGLVSSPDTVELSSLNVTPIADAGLDQIVVVASTVVLDGSGSSDGDNDPLTFLWTLVAIPAGSTTSIAGPTSSLASLTPDLEGTYVASLTVHDGFVASLADETEITVVSTTSFAEMKLLEACTFISELSPSAFDATGHQNVLCNFLSQAVKHVQQDKLSSAVAKIDDSIERTDGCEINGLPDPKGGAGADWLVDCSDQNAFLDILRQARNVLN